MFFVDLTKGVIQLKHPILGIKKMYYTKVVIDEQRKNIPECSSYPKNNHIITYCN